MMVVRRSEERGYADHGWLKSRHTFSFADYRDPAFMGFRNLRVINEDRVAPHGGFGTHPHRDMEIISYVLDGALSHKDSMGNGSVIRPGDVQRMTAGTGVRHSEANADPSAPVHFLQIWIIPDEAGIAPGYEQKTFADDEKRGRLRLVASPDAADGSVKLNADARPYATLLRGGERVTHSLAQGRNAWVHVARGTALLGETVLNAGDAAALTDAASLTLEGVDDAEVLVFDLP